jgi:hypothetical protein
MKNIFIVFALLMLLTGCEKVVDLKLDNSSGTVVIEGNITNTAGPYFIKITKSVSFDQTDNIGQRDTLTYAGNGNYKTNTLLGITGRTYNLKVIADGKTYTASSTMPAKINLDTLRIVTVAFAGETNYNVIPVYVDPIGLGNNYQFNLFKNGVLDKGYYLNNDYVNDGLQNQIPLRSNDIDFKLNDIALVEMRCIDLNIYNYYFTLSQIAFNGPGGGTTPSNPPSNISNGALGIFSAHTVQRKTIRIN